jgi:hypothetical protein
MVPVLVFAVKDSNNNTTNDVSNSSNGTEKVFGKKIPVEMMAHFEYPLAHERIGEKVNNRGVPDTTSGLEKIELLWDFPMDKHIRDIAFGDINGDGITDVVASVVDWGSTGWSVVGIKGNSGVVLWEFNQTRKVSNVEVGDINGDGSLEVILLDWDGNIYVLKGVDGEFLWSKSLTLKSLTIESHEIFGSEGKYLKVEDINHDGIAEIVVGNGDIVLLNGDSDVVWTFHGDDHVDYIDVGDLNNDGYEDIVTTKGYRSGGDSAIVYAISGKDGSRLWVYYIPPFNVSSTLYLSPQGISIAALSDNSKYVAVVFGLSGTDDKAYYQISAINGTTGKELWKYVDNMPSLSLDVTTGDLNGDGSDDVLQLGNEVVALDNKGKVLWQLPHSTEAAIVFDANKDGNPEVCMKYAIYGGVDGELITQLPRKDGETIIGGVQIVGVKDITGDTYPEIITGHNPSTGVRAFTVSHPAIPEREGVIAAQITAGADDGFVARTPELFRDDSTGIVIGTDLKISSFLRFPDVTIPGNATITKAYITVVPIVTNQVGPLVNISAGDDANPSAPISSSDYYARKRTASSVSWNASSWYAGESKNSTDISNVIQDLVDSYDYSSSTPILIFLDTVERGTDGRNQYFAAYEQTGYEPAKLHVEYVFSGADVVSPEITRVRVNAPEDVEKGERFEATIDVDSIKNFNTGLFDLSFNSNVVNVTDVVNGRLDGETIPADRWDFIAENTIRVLLDMPGTKGVNGSGYLAKVIFKVAGKSEDRSILDISNGMLVNNEAEEIPAEWIDDEIRITAFIEFGVGSTETTKRNEECLLLGMLGLPKHIRKNNKYT